MPQRLKAENCRSSHRKCSLKKSVLKSFSKFTGKYLCQSLFFNKVAGLRRVTLLLKRRLWYKCCSANVAMYLVTNTNWVSNLLRGYRRKKDDDDEETHFFLNYRKTKQCKDYINVFRTLTNIYDGAFFVNKFNGV